jgi:DNA repair protein RecO (recombination protein O)
LKNQHTPRVEAVVLRHSDWGEADRLLVIFSREGGKLRAVAKGVRRLRSRKAGHLEPFTCVSLMLARGRDLWIVTQAQTVDAYLPLRDDLVRTGYAAYVVELLDRFTYEEGENRSLYRLLCDTLQRLSQEPDLPPVVRYYELRLLDLVGFRPELFNCVGCGRKIEAVDQFFSAASGGVMCPDCGSKAAFARPVSMRALKFIRHYQRSSYPEALRAGLPQAVRAEMEALMQYYLTFILEQGLKTPDFIRAMEKKQPPSGGG